MIIVEEEPSWVAQVITSAVDFDHLDGVQQGARTAARSRNGDEEQTIFRRNTVADEPHVLDGL